MKKYTLLLLLLLVACSGDENSVLTELSNPVQVSTCPSPNDFRTYLLLAFPEEADILGNYEFQRWTTAPTLLFHKGVQSHEKAVIIQAVSAINESMPNYFKIRVSEQEVQFRNSRVNEAPGTILVSFHDRLEEDEIASGVIAAARFQTNLIEPSDTSEDRAIAYFSRSQMNSLSDQNQLNVAVHELFHALGYYQHNDFPTSVMSHYWGNQIIPPLPLIDQLGLMFLYTVLEDGDSPSVLDLYHIESYIEKNCVLPLRDS